MKHTRNGKAAILSLILLVSILAMALAGCGGEPDPYRGEWEAVEASLAGQTMSATDIFPDGLILRLEGGGRGSLVIEGQDNGLLWENAGDHIELKDNSGTATGYLEGEELILSNVADSGVDFRFVRIE